MRIFRYFTFDASHKLNHLPDGHKCARLHGHTYKLKVTLNGELQQPVGWVRDFAELKQIVTHNVIETLDHNNLNDIQGLDQPTAELIAVWIWNQLKPRLPELEEIELWENQNSGVLLNRQDSEALS